ncbi:hypothetical protein XFF6166_70038 [Xanthomonas citri pv. fuscans]|nr:hypothetical protein XFF6166_70038 [Xanthomonas citri pv. fuscans]SOO02045.1 hypothetical protein XFF6960_570006 [Xanthomonas citri pv. fuscans]SOO06036.1 hypothetical protein XFF7767_60006 [Xanthomonas citri pv. fuscans]SOO14798.1 hypothetical protein XFF7766_380039 [Xanthomonas citri pv. fuscans]
MPGGADLADALLVGRDVGLHRLGRPSLRGAFHPAAHSIASGNARCCAHAPQPRLFDFRQFHRHMKFAVGVFDCMGQESLRSRA